MADMIQIDEKVVEAFHSMYDYFPEPVTQVHKSKQIVATNLTGRELGKAPGMICSKQGRPEDHKIYRAPRAVKEHRPQWVKSTLPLRPEQEFVAFWLPIDGYPDFYAHFSIRYRMDYSAE